MISNKVPVKNTILSATYMVILFTVFLQVSFFACVSWAFTFGPTVVALTIYNDRVFSFQFWLDVRPYPSLINAIRFPNAFILLEGWKGFLYVGLTEAQLAAHGNRKSIPIYEKTAH